MDNPSVKNIIFDLGAVLLNIDFSATTQTFARLAGRDATWVDEKTNQFQCFLPYESGQWTDEQFRSAVRTTLELPLEDEAIDEAWNALLLDFPPERIALLQWLKSRYRTFLLSNTNPIHFRAVEGILARDTGLRSLHPLFEKVYLSYEMKTVKPLPEIYERVLQDNGLVPNETVFFDDNLLNIQGAQSLGIQSVAVRSPQTILDYFPNAPRR